MSRFRKLVLLLLILSQFTGSIALPLPLALQPAAPIASAAELPPDLANHWASGTVSYWMDQALLVGFEDGTARPDAILERAQMITFINRAMGFNAASSQQFSDVPGSEWYAHDFLLARQAGYFTGFDSNMAYPEQEVTRSEASTLLCRIFNLTPRTPFDDLSRFSDYETALVVSPARSSLEAMVERGFLDGYPDNTLRPNAPLTRAILMSMFSKIMALYLNEVGVNHDGHGATVTGDIVVRRAPATANNMTVNGDLVITPGAGDGSVTLNNLQVDGRILILGGGDIQINNCAANEVMINKAGGRRPVVTSASSDFERMLIYSPSDTDIDTASHLDTLIIYQPAADATVNVGPNPKTIELFSQQAQVTLSSTRGSSTSGSTTPEEPTPPATSEPSPGGVEIFDPSKPQVWMPIRNFRTTVGSQLYIEASVYPLSMTDRSINWASSKSDVVSVNAYGFITAHKEGLVTITATSKQRPELSASAVVIVDYRAATGIALNNTALTLAMKKSAKLQATLFPAGVAKGAVSWFSMDEKVATVDRNGTVKGVAIGKTSVIAYASENPSVQAKCSVSVTSSGTLVDRFTMARDVDTMTTGEIKSYEVQAVTPTKATLQEINWWSSDTAIAMVYNVYNSKTKRTDAEVHALTPGSFTLYGEAVDGGEATVQVKIAVEPRKADGFVWATGNNTSLKVGDRTTWNTRFIPPHAADQHVTWASTNPEYVSVDQNGQLWARKLTMGASVEIVAYATYYPSDIYPNIKPLRASVSVTGMELEFLNYFDATAPSQKSVRVPLNGTKTINIAVAPGNVEEKKLSFHPKDPTMLTATATGDTTATLTGLKPGVTQLEVIHDTSGRSMTLWIVVASNEFVTFLDRLRDITITNFSNMYEPEKFFYYNSNFEYEAASFFYAFYDLFGSRPQPDGSHEVVFYGSLNSWMCSITEGERLGRLPREAQTMARLLSAPNDLSMKLTTTEEEQWRVYRTFGSLWLTSEAGFDLGNIDYYNKLRKYLLFDNAVNTMAPFYSGQNVNTLNLNHLIARLDRDPHAFYDNNISNIARASAFISAYINQSEIIGGAATAQICTLPSMSQKTQAAERMVFGSLNYHDGALVPKKIELALMAKGYLYSDLDPLLEVVTFKTHVDDIIALPVYFPNLVHYIKNPTFNINLAMAYRNYSQLAPSASPEEVVSFINQKNVSGGDYVGLLTKLDGRSAIFRAGQRINELQLPLDQVELTAWRPDRVALYRLDGSAIYYPSQQLTFAWLGGRPVDFGPHILEITVTHGNIGVIAKLTLPVYVHGSDLENRRDLIASKLALSKPQNYQDLVDARVRRDDQNLDEPLVNNPSLFMLENVIPDEEIRSGWLDYFEWYYGLGTLNAVIDSLQDPNNIDEFWYRLREATVDPRSKETVIQDYTLFKFLDIYLQRWLNIESNNRKLSNDFLWYPGDFLKLGYLDPRVYIVDLTKMLVDASDMYNKENLDGFRSDCPLESHRTGLFFSKSYAFRQIGNIATVGELVESFIALCNDNPNPSNAANTTESATNWARDRLRNATQYAVHSYVDSNISPLPSTISQLHPDTIDANLWLHLRHIDDELLPLLTLPNNSRVRLIVLPGIILVGSAEDYDSQDKFYTGIGQPLLNIIYNLEKKHINQSVSDYGFKIRGDFEASWLNEGPVLLFDVDRNSGGVGDSDLRTLFYDPLRYLRPRDANSFSGTQHDHIELGRIVFDKPLDLTDRGQEQITNWNDELQHLILESLSLRNAFGYVNPKRLLPQEMGSMMLKQGPLERRQIDWELPSSDYDNVPDATYMQDAVRGLWESRTLFDLWWSDLFRQSSRLMNYSSYRYAAKPSLTEYAAFMHYAYPAKEEVVDDFGDKTYIMPDSATFTERGVYLINGRYRILGMPSRSNYTADTRYPNFNLLNSPGLYFSLETDQNLAFDGKTPARMFQVVGDDHTQEAPDQVRHRYDLPRVNLMQQIFYRHGWDGVMAYLYADTEAASLSELNIELFGSSTSSEVYKSWTDWTLQEWDRIRTTIPEATNQSIVGVTYWEWQKLMQNSADPGYLKEFFVDHMGVHTTNFKDELSDATASSPRNVTLGAIDTAYRMIDGVESEHLPANRLFPVNDPYVLSHGLPQYFPALWLLNVTAKVGDHAYRTAADNVKLMTYGYNTCDPSMLTSPSPSLSAPLSDTTVPSPNGDDNDLWVEDELDRLADAELSNIDREPINRAWAYGYEDILWMAFNEGGFTYSVNGETYKPRETDAHLLNLLIHPVVPVSERVELLTYSKPDRDAYLYRRTNPAYNVKYELAYQNYSLLYDNYDTQSTQNTVVERVNSLGTRYGQDLAEVLSVEALPIIWRENATLQGLLRSFLTLSSGAQNYPAQTDPRIVNMIYEEFLTPDTNDTRTRSYTFEAQGNDLRSGITFYYDYSTDPDVSAKPLRFDFHDLYTRLEISTLPTDSPQENAYKNAALDEYIKLHGSFSFLMPSSSTMDVFRLVTLTPGNTPLWNQEQFASNLATRKRLGVTSDVYYLESNFIAFSNTTLYQSGVSHTKADPFNYDTTPTSFPFLLYTSPQIGSDGSLRTSWKVSVTELASNNILSPSPGIVAFLTTSTTKGANYFFTDYVVMMEELINDCIYIPELYLNTDYSNLLIPSDTIGSGNFVGLTLEQAERLALLGHNLEEIRNLAPNQTTVVDILDNGRFNPYR